MTLLNKNPANSPRMKNTALNRYNPNGLGSWSLIKTVYPYIMRDASPALIINGIFKSLKIFKNDVLTVMAI